MRAGKPVQDFAGVDAYAGEIPFEKNAPSLVALQHDALVRALLRVLRPEAIERDAEFLGQLLSVTLGDFDSGNAAAASACGAVDLLLNISCDAFQAALLKIVA